MEFVANVEETLAREIKPRLPEGIYYQIAGQFEYKREADRRLLVLMPLCLFVIYLLLYIKFKSFSSALILASALPFSFVGAVILQYILQIKFSTAVWVGYIALFGVAVEDGIVILDYMRERTRDGFQVTEKALDAASLRVRPIIMTTATTVLALLPIMFASGAGSELMKPIAVPTVGGMITCTISNLFIIPVLFTWIESRREKTQPASAAGP